MSTPAGNATVVATTRPSLSFSAKQPPCRTATRRFTAQKFPSQRKRSRPADELSGGVGSSPSAVNGPPRSSGPWHQSMAPSGAVLVVPAKLRAATLTASASSVELSDSRSIAGSSTGSSCCCAIIT